MNIWYLLAVPGWLVIIITATARLHDLAGMRALRWHFRRAGLAGAGTIAAIMLFTPFANDGWLYAEPTWKSTMISSSFALVWLTTEGIPPWWNYILGVHRIEAPWQNMGLFARIRFELRALRESFRPRRQRDPGT